MEGESEDKAPSPEDIAKLRVIPGERVHGKSELPRNVIIVGAGLSANQSRPLTEMFLRGLKFESCLNVIVDGDVDPKVLAEFLALLSDVYSGLSAGDELVICWPSKEEVPAS